MSYTDGSLKLNGHISQILFINIFINIFFFFFVTG